MTRPPRRGLLAQPQPAGVLVPDAQLYVTEPPTPPMVHAPWHVTAHVPLAHDTWEPAPTVTLHLVPLHVTWQLLPQVPLQLDSAAQSSWHPGVSAVQASKAQVSPCGH